MSQHNFDAVLWDMDGTLIDSEPAWIEAQTRLVIEHGGSWSHADGLELVGSDMELTAAHMRAAGVRLGGDAIIDRLTTEVTEAFGRGISWRPGAVDLVTTLHGAGIPQAIVTTSPRSMAAAVAASLPVHAIALIIGGEDVTEGKPSPEPYLKAARQLGTRPERCIAVEDSPFGLQSAVSAGTIALGVKHDCELTLPTGWTPLETLQGLTLDRLDEIASISD